MTRPNKPKPFQTRWTVSVGNDKEGRDRLSLWKKASRLVKLNNPKRLNAWIRDVLDREASRILKK